jgi:hypothetical protein
MIDHRLNHLIYDCSSHSLYLISLACIVFNLNKHSKPRMVKFYQSVESEALQQTVIRRVFQQIAARPDSFCNYLEGIVPEWGEGIK